MMNKYYDPKQLKPNELVNIDIVERKHGMKMNKALEALEDLISFIDDGEVANTPELCEYVAKRKDAIERGFKRLEKIERAFNRLSKEDEQTKKLLSLEIEKNKKLQIIEKIFDLLKEVLL